MCLIFIDTFRLLIDLQPGGKEYHQRKQPDIGADLLDLEKVHYMVPECQEHQRGQGGDTQGDVGRKPGYAPGIAVLPGQDNGDRIGQGGNGRNHRYNGHERTQYTKRLRPVQPGDDGRKGDDNGLHPGSPRRHHSHIPHKLTFVSAVYESLHPGQKGLLVCG